MTRRAYSRPERGQGTLEFLGVLVVAAILIGSLVLAVTGSAHSVGQAVGCTIRSIATQSGSCGANIPPTEYNPDGPGVGGTPPDQVPPVGDGGGSPVPVSWDGASTDSSDQPYDQDKVDKGVGTFKDQLHGGFFGVRSGDLQDIQHMLEGLSGPELDAVIAGMSDKELKHWVDELDDGMFGSGWSRDRRRQLWNVIAAKASPATMRRLAKFTDEIEPAFKDVGGDDAHDGDSPVDHAKYTQVPHQLFVDGADPHDLAQGQIGDCWLIASMAALANGDPAQIQHIIHQNPNGTYTVTLYDDGHAVEVTVTPDIPTVDGDPVFADDSAVGPDGVYELWPQILEKAAAQYYGNYADLEGDWPSKALQLFTGKDVDTYDSDWFGLDDPDPPSLTSLNKVLDNGGAVLVSTDNKNRNKLYKAGSIVQGHAYYVLGISNGMVELANPWGIDAYPPLWLTYSEFEDSFIRYDIVK